MKSLKSSNVHNFFPTSFLHDVMFSFALRPLLAHLLRPAAFLRPWSTLRTTLGTKSRLQIPLRFLNFSKYLWCWLVLLLLLLFFIVFVRVVFRSSCLRSPAAPGYRHGGNTVNQKASACHGETDMTTSSPPTEENLSKSLPAGMCPRHQYVTHSTAGQVCDLSVTCHFSLVYVLLQ